MRYDRSAQAHGSMRTQDGSNAGVVMIKDFIFLVDAGRRPDMAQMLRGELEVKYARPVIYLGGCIPPRIFTTLQKLGFLEAFGKKRRFVGLLTQVLVKVFLKAKTGLIRAAADGL